MVDQNDEPVIKLVDEVLKLERKPLPYNKLVMVVLVQFWMNLKLVIMIHVSSFRFTYAALRRQNWHCKLSN